MLWKPKYQWRKEVIKSKRIEFGRSSMLLGVAIAHPDDSKGYPCIDLSLSCGKMNRIDLYFSSYGVYSQLLKNLAEEYAYFNDPVLGESIKAELEKAQAKHSQITPFDKIDGTLLDIIYQ